MIDFKIEQNKKKEKKDMNKLSSNVATRFETSIGSLKLIIRDMSKTR